MKKFVLTIMMLMPMTLFGAERSFNKSFDVAPNARFSLDCFKGEIKIRTGDVSTIQVNARIYPDEGPDSDLKYVSIDTSSASGYVRIEVEYDADSMSRTRRGEDNSSGILRNWSGTSLPFVDFDIVVPRDASLDLESHKSTFDVEAPAGAVRIETHKGTGTIKGVRNDFELSTHKGRFDVEIDKLADLEIDTHKGDVDVVIHDARDFSLRGETDSGKLDFEGYYVRVERDDHHGEYVSETIGSGIHRIDLDTHKGRIKLHFK